MKSNILWAYLSFFYLCVAAEAEHGLVDEILKDEVLVVIGGRQLDVLDDELVNHEVIGDDRLLEQLVARHILVRHLAAQDLGPHAPAQAVQWPRLQYRSQLRSIFICSWNNGKKFWIKVIGIYFFNIL